MINLEDRTKLVENALADHMETYNKDNKFQHGINKQVIDCLDDSYKSLSKINDGIYDEVKRVSSDIYLLWIAVIVLVASDICQALVILGVL